MGQLAEVRCPALCALGLAIAGVDRSAGRHRPQRCRSSEVAARVRAYSPHRRHIGLLGAGRARARLRQLRSRHRSVGGRAGRRSTRSRAAVATGARAAVERSHRRCRTDAGQTARCGYRRHPRCRRRNREASGPGAGRAHQLYSRDRRGSGQRSRLVFAGCGPERARTHATGTPQSAARARAQRRRRRLRGRARDPRNLCQSLRCSGASVRAGVASQSVRLRRTHRYRIVAAEARPAAASARRAIARGSDGTQVRPRKGVYRDRVLPDRTPSRRHHDLAAGGRPR